MNAQIQIDACMIEERMFKCFNLTADFIKSDYIDYGWYVNHNYILKWLDFIGPVVTFPILAALAFVCNLLVVLTITITNRRNKKDSPFDSKMFDYILANSVINCVECLVYQLKLVTICISPGAIFCSVIKDSSIAIFIGDYINGYFGETMKTASIITSLCFSLQRYVETSDQKSTFLARCAKIKVKTAVFTIMTISAHFISYQIL